MHNENTPLTPKKTLVWDFSTRLFHWLVTLLLLFQWLSGEILDDMINWHVITGYVLLGLIIFRIIWGFVGPKYARFSQFIYGPKSIFRYSKTLFQHNSEIHASHNPLGGLAVIVMLLLLLVQAVSGLFITDDIFTSGPYHTAVSSFWQDTFASIHSLSFDILKILIGLHIIAIIYYGHYSKQQLIAAMIHGKKPMETQPIKSQRWLIAIIVALAVAGFVYLLVEVWPPVEEDFYDF